MVSILLEGYNTEKRKSNNVKIKIIPFCHKSFDETVPSNMDFKIKPEDHWSCIAHLSKSAVIEEKKFKHSPRVGADNPLGPTFL